MKTLLAFLGGAAVGATLGVLFAPDRGEETRKRIATVLREKGISLENDELDDLIAQLRHTLHTDPAECVAPSAEAITPTPETKPAHTKK